MNKVIIITGGSSGIGFEASKALSSLGNKVYTVSRRDFSYDRLTHIRADVTIEDEVKRAVEYVVSKEGHIDVLVNSAGFGLAGAIEFTSREEAFSQFNTGFFALDSFTRNVLPVMREQGYGKIINISSMAALAPLPFQSYYSAMKSAVNTYTLALRSEVGIYGIQACAIMPGDIKSGFTSARRGSLSGDEEYKGRISRSIGKMAEDEQTGPDPSAAGRLIAKLAEKKKLKPLYTIDIVSKCEALLFKFLPVRLSNYIVGRIYGQY